MHKLLLLIGWVRGGGVVQIVDLGNFFIADSRLENYKCCICGVFQAVIVDLAKKLCRLSIQICRLWKCCLKCCRSTLGHLHKERKQQIKQRLLLVNVALNWYPSLQTVDNGGSIEYQHG